MLFDDEEKCLIYLTQNDKFLYKEGSGCNGTFDGLVCWNATKASSTLKISCPKIDGLFNSSKFLSKKCESTGIWEGFNLTKKHSGFTDFTSCFTENVNDLSQELTNDDIIVYKVVSYIEPIGLILSIICLSFSLFVFNFHKNILEKKITKIHINLFITILLQSIIRIGFLFDRFLFKTLNPNKFAYESQINLYHRSLCPCLTSLLEYLQLCNFMWMLNEGLDLNISLTYSIFHNNKKSTLILYHITGWGFPAVIISIWMLTLLNTIGFDDICWFGYFGWKSYWIIEGPIFVALLANLICLGNVIRILRNVIEKNRRSGIDQIRKSVKAMIVLVPLLGITHIFEVYHKNPKNFVISVILSVINAILVFNQGLFLSLIYCFLNRDVQNVIKRKWFQRFNSEPLSKKSCNNRHQSKNVDLNKDSQPKNISMTTENFNNLANEITKC